MRGAPDVPSTRTLSVVRTPRGVDEARRFAELAVTYCDTACREATSMVVTELAENIVKYGARATGVFAGSISIALEETNICIRATNQVDLESDARRVEDAIARIGAAGDIRELYRSRLAELFANPGLARAQLGLLRAAFEGGFRLSCSYEPPSLTIVAERPCERR